MQTPGYNHFTCAWYEHDDGKLGLEWTLWFRDGNDDGELCVGTLEGEVTLKRLKDELRELVEEGLLYNYQVNDMWTRLTEEKQDGVKILIPL